MGSVKPTPEEKAKYYKEAFDFASAAIKLDSNSAEANYMMAVVYGRMWEVEKKNEELVEYVKNTKRYVDKAIQLNPEYARAYHILGRWHLDVLLLNSIKKTALKLIFGTMGEATIKDAIANMEKCKTMEPYYCHNFYDLARAYQFNKQYEKGIEVLEQLQKLPTRRQLDVQIKADGAVLLQKLQ